jgi:MoaA/NifB/PqqE/SkfB family radical SAM enzyme
MSGRSPGSARQVVSRALDAVARRFAPEPAALSCSERLAERAGQPAGSDVPRAPMQLRVEVVNLCNANCVFCTYQFQTREIETMSLETFKLTVDQFTALGGRDVSFTPVVGDSLIDRGLEEKVAYVRSFPQYQRIEIWTNAILLTRERFEALVESGITEFNISMSGFTPAEYEQLYRNKNYAKIIRNLTAIAESELVRKVKFVVWARTGTAEPEKEPDYIKLRDADAFGIIFQKNMFSWHGQIKPSDLPGDMFMMKPPEDQSRPCLHLWAGFTVMSNGDMTVCGCTDTDGFGLPLGNVRDVPIDAHLKDGRWAKLRDGFLAGEPPSFCKGCDMYWPVEAHADLTRGDRSLTETLEAVAGAPQMHDGSLQATD